MLKEIGCWQQTQITKRKRLVSAIQP